MPSITESSLGRHYWRSLEELAGAPELCALMERELSGTADEAPGSTTRREFLNVMAASLALAGLTGCRWPAETIVPHTRPPAGQTPGVPVRFATAMELNGVATGLLVTSYDGRPIKIEGNELHPFSQGATDAIAQASVLDLYDPDRSQCPIRSEVVGGERTKSTWDEFVRFAATHFSQLQRRKGAGLCVLSEASASPSVMHMRARLLELLPQARWYEYEPISRDNERAGAALAFGKPYRSHLLLERADRVVCLDADLLMTHPAAVKYARDFARRRRADDGTMNRLYAVENAHTVTGAMADQRWAARSGEVARFAGQLAAELLRQGLELPADIGRLAARSDGRADWPWSASQLGQIARDLLDHRGRCVLAVGPRQPPEVHALAHLLNAALGNVGQTVTYTADPEPDRPSHLEAIGSLVERIRARQVDTLLILGGNPVFNAPADLGFAERLQSVPTTIHLSLYDDETSQLCTWHLPRAHYLESWGDARAYDGTVSIVQPLIEPLYGGKSAIELLAMLTGDELATGYEIVARTFYREFVGSADFMQSWHAALHDGVVAGTAWPAQQPVVRNMDWLAGLGPSLRRREDAGKARVEVVFDQDQRIYDGRFANNGWLQELPDPMTKLTWDNAALIAPATAARFGLSSGDVVTLRNGDRALEIAVLVMPGQAADSVTVPLGYGRRAAGRVGNGVGFDAYALRTSEAMGWADSVQIERANRRHPLATTQDHHPIASALEESETQARAGALVREATLAEYQTDPTFARYAAAHPPLVSLWTEREYMGRRWGMAIDLTACIGCGACVVACQAENNVPVVGKNEVRRGREMHWLRVDRYFSGPPAAPAVVHQPVTCQHCENAPCEQVCPVAATVHSKEGLNDQVYSRCIGSRYCENNCPYKVRRFNWFNNHKHLSEIRKMGFNPEVSVRSRGVMEKCTYCIQRITAARISATVEQQPIEDGQVTPACAQACPTRAIVFGDLNDPNSRVRKLHDHHRAYALLAELNVKPRTVYLAKLRNPASSGSGQL